MDKVQEFLATTVLFYDVLEEIKTFSTFVVVESRIRILRCYRGFEAPCLPDN